MGCGDSRGGGRYIRQCLIKAQLFLPRSERFNGPPLPRNRGVMDLLGRTGLFILNVMRTLVIVRLRSRSRSGEGQVKVRNVRVRSESGLSHVSLKT